MTGIMRVERDKRLGSRYAVNVGKDRIKGNEIMHTTRLAFIILLISLATHPAWSIEAELKSGQSIQADRMTFDGETVTLYKDNARHSVKASEIKYLTADTAARKKAEEQNAALQQRVEKYIDSVEKLESLLLKAEEDLIRERTRYGELLEKNRKLEKTLSASDLAETRRKLSRLESQNSQATQTIKQLRDELRVAKSVMQDAANGKQPVADAAKIEIDDPRYEKVNGEKLVQVLGQVTNTTALQLDAIVIEVTALDKSATPLASRLTFVSNVPPGNKTTWRTDLQVEYEEISQLRARVADVVPANKR